MVIISFCWEAYPLLKLTSFGEKNLSLGRLRSLIILLPKIFTLEVQGLDHFLECFFSKNY